MISPRYLLLCRACSVLIYNSFYLIWCVSVLYIHSIFLTRGYTENDLIGVSRFDRRNFKDLSYLVLGVFCIHSSFNLEVTALSTIILLSVWSRSVLIPCLNTISSQLYAGTLMSALEWSHEPDPFSFYNTSHGECIILVAQLVLF